jgi:uncharacterized protein YndB with AHSA1/START domain/catechol 2,3-dioxygenase-like lactoylglutathione lyase family enzyme
MKTDIAISQTYPHPIARVWAALTSAEALAAWFMPNDFEPVVGHEFTFRTQPAPGFDGIVRCRVLEVTPPTRMVWSWRGGPLDTTVTFDLTALDERTTLFEMHHLGFVGLGAQLARTVMAGGYPRIYGVRLPAYLDHLAGHALAGGYPPCTTDHQEAKPMSALDAITVISVPVTDQQTSKSFYLDQLGFTLVADAEQGENPNGRWIQLAPPGGGATITLVTWFDDMRPGSCKLVLGTADADEAHAELVGRGVKVSGEPRDEVWGRYFGLDDPDGNNWLVIQHRPAS